VTGRLNKDAQIGSELSVIVYELDDPPKEPQQ
jgi:hypothetical protein